MATSDKEMNLAKRPALLPSTGLGQLLANPWFRLSLATLAIGYLVGWVIGQVAPAAVGLGVGVILFLVAVLAFARGQSELALPPAQSPPQPKAPPRAATTASAQVWEASAEVITWGQPQPKPVQVSTVAPSTPQPLAQPVSSIPPAASPTLSLPSLPTWQAPALSNVPWLASFTRERVLALAPLLFAFSVLIYAITRLYAIDEFPIYFFTDEAIHPVLGTELISRGFKDGQGRLFPPYFQNGQYWNLSLSVYIQGVTAWLFGKSVFVTRATSALISLSAAVAIAMILRMVFKNRSWWLAVLVFATIPAWFLHSRTAFEVILMVSFYSWFLLFYLLYRTRSPIFLYPALVFGAATFYSYANGQAVMAVSGVLLLLSDLRYHLKNWRYGAVGVAVILILAMPYLRFRSEQPTALNNQLRLLDSYLFRAMPVQEKAAEFVKRYATGLSPSFWFFPYTKELERHQWKDLGNLHWVTLPFWLIGVAVAFWRIRSPQYRALLVASLAAPFGASLADIGILRVLAFIVPATVLITLGIDALLSWLKSSQAYAVGAVACFVFGAVGSLAMLREGVVNGPRWFENYGLYGMQWGTKQIFGYVPDYLRQRPDVKVVYISPSWANGTDIFMRFFMPGEGRAQIANVDAYISDKRDLDPNAVFIMTPDEVQRAVASQKFKPIQPEQAIPYPNGSEGFIFTRLSYVDNVDRIFTAEQEARKRPVTVQFALKGENVTINHSVIDSGQLKDILDGDKFTLGRGREANPFLFEIIYPTPRPIQTLSADLGSMEFSLTVTLYASDADPPVQYSQSYRGLPPDPHVDMPFANAPPQVKRVRIEIKDLNAGERTHIHIRELELK